MEHSSQESDGVSSLSSCDSDPETLLKEAQIHNIFSFLKDNSPAKVFKDYVKQSMCNSPTVKGKTKDMID